MLMPKNVKYRRQHRGRRNGPATRGNTSPLAITRFRRPKPVGLLRVKSKARAALSEATSSAADSCGFGFFPISR